MAPRAVAAALVLLWAAPAGRVAALQAVVGLSLDSDGECITFVWDAALSSGERGGLGLDTLLSLCTRAGYPQEACLGARAALVARRGGGGRLPVEAADEACSALAVELAARRSQSGDSQRVMLGGRREAANLARLDDAAQRKKRFDFERRAGPQECADEPSWISANGRQCGDYSSRNWCTRDGGYGVGWPTAAGTFEQWASSSGIIATEACCACGGGSTRNILDAAVAKVHKTIAESDANGDSAQSGALKKYVPPTNSSIDIPANVQQLDGQIEAMAEELDTLVEQEAEIRKAMAQAREARQKHEATIAAAEAQSASTARLPNGNDT